MSAIKSHHPVGSAENPVADPVRYMFLFRHGTWDKDLSSDQVSTVMDEVALWFDGIASRGIVIGGTPLYEGGKSIALRDGRIAVTDGPFAEAKEAVAGYLIIQVETEDEAVAIAQTSPLLKHGMITEVRRIAPECPVHERLRQRAATV
ncbi:YciI family protein [Luteolibacter sp. GHJ8]|uniref:YciI family protein n=1 Tax=Luteolibacter rhizosphaerae TaxID=2989719 RepID=A0ABT3GC67_9BACT|nr:YciI family protein [Luteolibacter rhizosphaerae]MCW1916805.1 YciI family protein [Luteolibacter rhizosphaerae]